MILPTSFAFLIPGTTFLEVIWEILITFIVWKILNTLYKTFIRRGFNLEDRYGKDSWAIITGATDGIGKGWAVALAKRNFNLILVSRTESKLKKTKEELSNQFKSIKIEIIPFDFSVKTNLKDYNVAFSNLSQDISILVNNVGVSHEDYFYRLNEYEYIHNYIDVNVYAMTFLTKIFMHKMEKRQKKSGIITMSSIAADVPYPGNAIYTATKAYNDNLSRALVGEYGYEKSKIDFISSRPGYVESNMSQMKPDGFDCITVEQHCESVLAELGQEEWTNGYWTHKLQSFVLRNSPVFLQRYFFADAKAKEEKLQARHNNKQKAN